MISTACAADYPEQTKPIAVSTTMVWNGTTLTGSAYIGSSTPPPTPTSTWITTFDAEQASELFAVATVEPVYLVHQPSDADQPLEASGIENAASPTETNAAPSRIAHWGQARGFALVYLIAAMALAMPW
jgi:hypothetical protein